MTESTFRRLSDAGEAALKHYGVPGMRWGVRRENLQTAARVAKTTGATVAKIGVRVGVTAVLGAVGVPTVVAGATAATVMATNPEIIGVGKDYAKLTLDEMGFMNMSSLDKLKAYGNITQWRIRESVR